MTDPPAAPRPERTENPEDPEDPEDQSEPRPDDGLDLARAITAATAATDLPELRRRPGRDATRRRSSGTVGTRLSGAHPDDRDPQLLDGEVARLVGERGWALTLRMQGVFVRWADIVGPDIAAHATPETFADGTLVARTDSTAWAVQLRLLAPDVVRRLNDDLGAGTVRVLDVVGPRGPSWKRGPRSVRDGRGPRDTYG